MAGGGGGPPGGTSLAALADAFAEAFAQEPCLTAQANTFRCDVTMRPDGHEVDISSYCHLWLSSWDRFSGARWFTRPRIAPDAVAADEAADSCAHFAHRGVCFVDTITGYSVSAAMRHLSERLLPRVGARGWLPGGRPGQGIGALGESRGKRGACRFLGLLRLLDFLVTAAMLFRHGPTLAIAPRMTRGVSTAPTFCAL